MGRNPRFHSLSTTDTLSNSASYVSEYIDNNLEVLLAAHNARVQQQTSERFQRAFCGRHPTDSRYCSGDLVYYQRANLPDCIGPATVIAKGYQQVLIKHGGSFIRAYPCQLKHHQVKPNLMSDKEVSNAQNSSSNKMLKSSFSLDQQVSSEDEDHADDNYPDKLNSIESETGVGRETFADNENNRDVLEPAQNDASVNPKVTESKNSLSRDTWVKVKNNTNLPKPNTAVECSFPGVDHSIKCQVLSKAGKSSTANWHYLNILQDGDSKGKCCSFKDVSWRSRSDTADKLLSDTHD